MMAQTIVKGNVSEALSGECIIGANVMIKTQKGQLLGFTQSDEEGNFSINIKAAADSLTINATMFGYKPYSAILDDCTKSVEILMQDGAQDLQEVIVKADRIRAKGDTITYDVAGFAQKQDRTIGDVLNRIPGIDVADNGKIQYQGVDINKFYIEGIDLLGGKYGIATNGISHTDIGAVEVIERHQPLQVLTGISFSDQAAINLKMKDSAKATLLVNGTLGAGWSAQPQGALWQGDLFTMIATGSYQMITTLKADNTGRELSDQLIDFTFDSSDESMERYISLSAPGAPRLEKKRSYFNRSWMASSSHLFKAANGNEFKAQIDYINDRVTARGSNTTTYFLDSGDAVVMEDKSSLAHRSALTGKFSLEANKKTYFLNNTLTADLSWDDMTLATTGTLPNTQSARMPEYSVSNRLKIIKRFNNNKLVTFNSRNEWKSMPESLTVSHDGSEYGQRVGQHSFLTDERAALGFIFNRLMLSLEAGLSGYFRSLDTDLWGVELPEAVDTERLSTDYLRIFASPKLEWHYKKLELRLDCPVNVYSYFFSGGLRDRTEFFLSPSLEAFFRLTPRMSLSLRGSAHRSPASLHDIHESSILTDYRSISSGIDDYYAGAGQSVSASYNYRNTQIGLFLSALANYGWNKSDFGTAQYVVGDYIFYSYDSTPSESRSAFALINVGKTLDFMRGAVGVRGNFRRLDSSVMSQGLPTDYGNTNILISPFANGNISSYLNWNLRFTWEKSLLSIADMSPQSYDNFTYAGNITLTPCTLITLTAGGEFYHNMIQSGRYKDIFMLDAKLTFNVGRRIEISASVSNILNRKEYAYTTYGTLSRYEHSCMLRGREFMVSIYLKK